MSKRTLIVPIIAAALMVMGTATVFASGSSEKNATSTAAGNVTLKVEVFDRGNAPSGLSVTSNPVATYIQKNFGDPNNIKVEFVPVPRSQERSKLNVMMATNDAPDIVFTYDVNLVYKYVSEGGLTALGPDVDKYGQDLKKALGDLVLSYGVWNGKQYALPAKRADLGKYGELIRKDWLAKLNLPLPTTTDQLVSDLKAFKAKDPGNVGKQLIPMGFANVPASWEPVIWPFIVNSNLTKEQFFTLSQPNNIPLLLPGHKAAIKFLNTLYHEGLLSPDFALDKDRKQLSQDIITGRTGFFTEDLGKPFQPQPGDYANLEANVPGAQLAAVDTFTNAQGKHPKPLYDPIGMYVMVPKSSKNAAAAVKYLNWMMTPSAYTFVNYGVEGVSYKVENGLKIGLNTPAAENYTFVLGDIHLMNNGVQLSPHDWALQYASNHPEFVQPAEQNYKDSLVDGFHYVHLPHPLDASTKYSTTLRQDYEQFLAATIMADPAQLDQVYNQYLQQYLQDGGQQVENARKALWNQTHS
jgi:putative aldouronate transport system substrate-binding protein